MRNTAMTAAVLALSLAACDSPETRDVPAGDAAADGAATDSAPTAAPDSASATLMTADGMQVGTVTARSVAEGVAMRIELDLPGSGPHGAHVHDVGTCEPDFMASGPHWAPFDNELNLANDDEDDDSENAMVEVGEDGSGVLEYTLAGGITLAQMLDGDGSSFMIHQRADDPQMEAAEGNGDRIACGVFAAG